jgi:4-hydroxybenzoate polyprenyltransferase
LTSQVESIPPPRWLLLARDIKLSHSIFALPFALLATFLASYETRGEWPTPAVLGLIVLCMVLARTVAMTANRLLDARFDATNPRTAGRAIPSGRLSSRYVLLATVLCAAAFVAATAGFWLLRGNVWPLLLSPLVLAWLASYSLMKRFTWLCHLVLGSALAISPLAAAIAVEPAYLRQPQPWLLAAMVLCWVAGFDIIYALQDVAVDRATGLYSLPSRLGEAPALWISRGLHALSLAALITLARTSSALHLAFAAGVGLVALLLVVEHAVVWRAPQQRHIHMAFFTLNGIISVALGTLGILDIVA